MAEYTRGKAGLKKRTMSLLLDRLKSEMSVGHPSRDNSQALRQTCLELHQEVRATDKGFGIISIEGFSWWISHLGPVHRVRKTEH